MSYIIEDQTIIFDNNFNSKITEDMFINSIKKIIFGLRYNQPSKIFLPDTIKSIEFTGIFNLNISCKIEENSFLLPSKLNTIILGAYFNKSLDNLPSTIESIIFCSCSIFDIEINIIERIFIRKNWRSQ